jgi:hypothetical protein
MASYKHLAENERFVIELMLNKGDSQGKETFRIFV